jgi:hypothetical protein
MKGLAIGAMILVSLPPRPCHAQRAVFRVQTHFGPRFTPNFGLPSVGPIPPLGPIRSFPDRPTFDQFFGHGLNRNLGCEFLGAGFNGGSGCGFFGQGLSSDFGGGYPAFYASPDYNSEGYQGYQIPAIVMPPLPVQPPLIPEPPVRPQMHEYVWKDTGVSHSGIFTIVLRDGTTRIAVAVWAQGTMIHYVDANNRTGSFPLRSIDRESTMRVNTEKHLTLQLPGENNLSVVR